MITRFSGILMAGGMGLALAACGSSATSGTGSTGGESMTLEARDFQFSQTTLTFPANTTINLTVKNAGTVHHNFSIKELGANKDIETPGASETVTFTSKGNATYTFYCEYHRDSKGMQGTATVGTGSAGAASSPAPTTTTSAKPTIGY